MSPSTDCGVFKLLMSLFIIFRSQHLMAAVSTRNSLTIVANCHVAYKITYQLRQLRFCMYAYVYRLMPIHIGISQEPNSAINKTYLTHSARLQSLPVNRLILLNYSCVLAKMTAINTMRNVYPRNFVVEDYLVCIRLPICLCAGNP